ncbi:MAG TPA: DinB family protein [Fimbriimonas sp.]|nr:DinB family protein [Fimbriimonas sp.]
MNPEIELTIGKLTDMKGRLERVFANTPDDRVAWSPSPTARTPLGQVAHCANSLGFIATMLEGTPYGAPTTVEADKNFLELEKEVDTREKATELLNRNFDRYITLLQNTTAEDLDKMIALPFGMGEAPFRFVMSAGYDHTLCHLGQLEYMQTIYGDRVW